MQCVADFRWQMMSWCDSGNRAAANRYTVSRVFNRTPRRATVISSDYTAVGSWKLVAGSWTCKLILPQPMFPVSDVIPSRSTPFVTVGLISANALAFLYELQLPAAELDHLVQTYGVVPASFSWLTVPSSLFFHIGWIHILGNSLALWLFGDNVEDRLGHARFAILYLVCASAAALAQTASQPFSTVPMIGASGAIAGVMGAYFVIFPQSRVLTAVFAVVFYDLIEVPAAFFLGIWFLLQFFSGVGSLGASAADGAIAFWAHVVGFGTGALAGGLWRVLEARRRRGWEY